MVSRQTLIEILNIHHHNWTFSLMLISLTCCCFCMTLHSTMMQQLHHTKFSFRRHCFGQIWTCGQTNGHADASIPPPQLFPFRGYKERDWIQIVKLEGKGRRENSRLHHYLRMMSNMMSICCIITHTNLSVQTHHGFSNFRTGYMCVGQKYREERQTDRQTERERREGGGDREVGI